jgi:hypothetical protein
MPKRNKMLAPQLAEEAKSLVALAFRNCPTPSGPAYFNHVVVLTDF